MADFKPRTDLVTRIIGGTPRYFDASGTEYDLFHRPLLSKSPELTAQLRRMSDEAKLRTKIAFDNAPAAVKQHRSEIEEKRSRVRTLNDRIFDNGKVKDFYVNTRDPDWLADKLAEVDREIKAALAWRNRLLDAIVDSDLRIDQCDETIGQAKVEIKELEQQIRELENRDKPKAEAKAKPVGMTVEKLMAKIGPATIQVWLDNGIKLEDVVAQINA